MKQGKPDLKRQTQPPPAEMNQLMALFNTGRYAELESRALFLVKQYPDSGHVWMGLSLSLQMQGKDALQALQKTAELMPRDAIAHNNLANTLRERGQLDAAVASSRRALKLQPVFAEAHNNLGLALLALGQTDAAVTSLRRAVAIQPKFPEAHSNLGNALLVQGQVEGAVASCRRAVELKPDFADAHANLGNALKESGQLDAANASYRRALQLKPDFAEAHNNLGTVLKELGQFEEAVASYRRALQLKPNYAEWHNNLGNALLALGQHAEAMASYHRAIEIEPDYAEPHNNLGCALLGLDQFEAALSSCRLSLKFKPDYAEAHNTLGVALKELGQLDAALTSYRRAVELKPDSAEAHNNLGVILLDLGKPNDALASYRQALKIKPDYADAFSGFLFCLNHSEAIAPQALFAEHREFAEQFETPLRAEWPPHHNVRDPGRCLQIGFVSGDLRNHAVAHFIEAVLAQLSAHPQLSLHAYYNHVVEDSVTQRLRKSFRYWHPIAGLSDVALAKKIYADGIDILIDLSGHTAKNRLLTFARKPAPIQLSWIGYPGTTGLSAMDYYQSDRFLFPDSRFDDQFTEKIVRLPASSAFLPSSEAPPVNSLPALNNGYITFGSFNRLNKISRSVIALWAQLLRALPNSKMLLGAMPQDGKYQGLIDWFAQEGIAPERLIFHARSNMGNYLALHHQVDICLDTFPYNGGTTTFHALWMGVPTLTLAGRTVAGWAGASILGHVGLETFAAHDPADFVQKGLAWADKLSELSEIRCGLRQRFAKSARGQPALIAASVERALRIMWQRWCAGLPAESFEVPIPESQ
jgi:protein O-GlcNAc transferase